MNEAKFCFLDMTFGLIKPKKGQKISIPLGSGATLEVRYTGNPKVKWYFNGKEIPMTAKSKHFEFVDVGISFPMFGPILKIKNFKKELAGDYKVEIQKSGCAYSKIIKVEVDSELKRFLSITLSLSSECFYIYLLQFLYCMVLIGDDAEIYLQLR